MSITVKVSLNRFGALSSQLRQGVDAIVQTTAAAIEGDAKQRAPVDTGFLRNSIQTRKVGEAEAMVEVGASYGVHQEYGTVHQTGTPFLTPAAEAQRAPFEARLKQVLG